MIIIKPTAWELAEELFVYLLGIMGNQRLGGCGSRTTGQDI